MFERIFIVIEIIDKTTNWCNY